MTARKVVPDINEQTKTELDILRRREASALAEAKTSNAITESMHRRERFNIRLLKLAPHLIAQKLELARLESDILRAREATALAEAKTKHVATALILARQKAYIAELAAAPSAPQRKATEMVETAAISLKHILFTLQQGLHYFLLYIHNCNH